MSKEFLHNYLLDEKDAVNLFLSEQVDKNTPSYKKAISYRNIVYRRLRELKIKGQNELKGQGIAEAIPAV